VEFKHREVCFGVQGQNQIAAVVESQEHECASFVSFSQGTTSTLHYLGNRADCSTISSVLLIAPVADPSDIVQHHAQMKYLYVPQWLATLFLQKRFPDYDPAAGTPVEQIAKIKNLPENCPVIIIHGTNDRTSPWTQGYKIAEAFYQRGHQAVYFIEHSGGHNQPYSAELMKACEQAIAPLSETLSGREFKERKREIQDQLYHPERQEIAEKLAAIYSKHGLGNQSSCSLEESIAIADGFLFTNQRDRMMKKYQQIHIFRMLSQAAVGAAIVGFGFLCRLLKRYFF
jgi:predicted alpha/beta hydrolase family esterase